VTDQQVSNQTRERYGVRRGPLATPAAALKLWTRHLPALTVIAIVPAIAELLVEAVVLALLGDELAGREALYTATSTAALLTFPLAYGATAGSFLLLDARLRGIDRQLGALRFFGRGLKFFGRLFGVFFLMGLALLVPFAPALVLYTLDLVTAAIPLAVAAAGFDLWLLVRWSVAAPAAVVENITFSVAFERSKGLIRGSWWIGLVTLLLFAAGAAAIAWLLTSAAGTIAVDADTAAPDLGANCLVNVIVAPLFDCALFTLYAALRDRALTAPAAG
jgi:hypothetical protein